MFRLHDATRRRLGVAAFLILGVLPTMLIVAWCIDQHLPGRVSSEAAALSQRLGLRVKLGGLQYVRPGIVLYEEVEVGDPETGRPIFRCRLLEVSRRRQSDAKGESRCELTMTASQPEVEADGLDRIWQCLQRVLKGVSGPLPSDVAFSTPELTLNAPRNSQTLTEVKASLQDVSGGTHAQIDFRLVGADTPEPARVRIGRDRQSTPPTTRFELYTGDGELPCSVLAMGVDLLKPLGPRCRFRGYLWSSETPDGWQGEVTGQLVDVDFGRLISDHFPHRFVGTGEMTVQSARFNRGRLESGGAIVFAGPGSIARSLLSAAVDRLGLVQGAAPPTDDEIVPFDQLAFSATLDPDGLHLSGRCKVAEPGTILSADGRCLLAQSLQRTLPTVALVRMLVPQSAVQVPASRQTDWLLRHLPVPEVVPVPGSDTMPHARLRLYDAWQR